ncbi:MAG: SMI1/KNR4 family protein [Kofleriaceae bacterium]|nr:SMI1/KNR4 family protein [Kofleriaceae bacterium]
MPRNVQLANAIDSIKTWMLEHGASLLVENLAPGATLELLDEVEAEFGFPIPGDLRDLWRIHNGQHEELNGFVDHLDLFDTQRAISELETVLMFVEDLRESPDDWSEAGIAPTEAKSNHWIPFAGRDSDLIVVSSVSGHVFTCGKDAPPLHLIANSILQWAEEYAARVVADDYAVEDGFGDYYLALRDRQHEKCEQELAIKRAEEERYRNETPLLAQLNEALSKKDADCCRDIFKRAAAENNPELFSQAIDLLFSTKADPTLTATALQWVLSKVTLTPDQWAKVAKGGALLENNAISNFALARSRIAPASTKP